MLALDADAKDDVALVLERDETGPGLLLAVRGIELDLVLARVHGDDAVVAQLLAADRGGLLVLLRQGGLVHDLGHGAVLAPVGVDDGHLCALKGREDMGLEGHGGTHRVVAVDDQEQHRVVVREVGHGEGAGTGVAQAELELVAALERRVEVAARLVGHRGLRRQALGTAEDVHLGRVRERVAHAKLMFELERGHKAPHVQRRVGRLVRAVPELHLACHRQGARRKCDGLQIADRHAERGGNAMAAGASLPELTFLGQT
mmetsp:Transcript_70764/g.179149  ORF Transcript_70764/g.179149 Transcript_70764/m.179149 type:complete len:259 (+) Transcript_70764:234-1010(+)